jgi:hypothetical protein
MGGELMSYTWLVYNTTTGAIGTSSSSHSPMQQTTTVTVTDADGTQVSTKTTTTRTQSTDIGTTTTYRTTATVTLTGKPSTTVAAFTFTDASGNVWSVPQTTLNAEGTATATATCEVTDAPVALTAGTLTPPAALTGLSNNASTTTETVTAIAFDAALLGTNIDLISIYTDTADMPTDTALAYATPAAYLYQSGAFVANPVYNADAIALKQAQAAQSLLIEESFGEAMAEGVTSSATGTAETYLVNATTIADTAFARTITSTNYPASGIEAQLLSGDYVALDYDQMQTFSNDLQNFYLPLRSQRISLLSQIKAATTVAQVQAVVWP